MKKIIFSVTFLFITTCLFAKEKNKETQNVKFFHKGINVFSLGYGALSQIENEMKRSDYMNIKYSNFGPIYFKYEHAISNRIGLGLSVYNQHATSTYSQMSFDSLYNHKDVYSLLKCNIRFNYHFGNSKKFDPYVGIGGGYGKETFVRTTNEPNFILLGRRPITPIGYELTGGCRYVFNKHLGAYAEVLLIQSLLQAGVVYKL